MTTPTLTESLRGAAISDGIIDDASRCLCHEAANRIEVLEKDIADTMGRLARVTNSNREQQQAAQEWADKYKSLQQKLAKERQARELAEGENARLREALVYARPLLDIVLDIEAEEEFRHRISVFGETQKPI